jgi:hypothetical protein
MTGLDFRMTGLDFAVEEELSSAFELCLRFVCVSSAVLLLYTGKFCENGLVRKLRKWICRVSVY